MDLQSHRAIATGMMVVGSDNGKVGRIVEVARDYIVVEKGFFFPADYVIPIEAISGVGPHKVYLSVTKHEALSQGWDQARVTGEPGYDETGAGLGPDDAGAAGPGEGAPGFITAEHVVRGDTETIRVPVYAEELTAVTRDVDRGAILIEKELVTEERTITVPVTEERVRVTRVPVGTPGAVGADAFENGAIEVPIRGQEVDIEKAVRKAGEVVVEKEAVTRSETVGGTVRREEVRVEDQTVDVDLVDDDRRR